MENVADAYFCENNDDEENMNLTLWLCGHAVGSLMMDFNNISLSKSPCMTSEFTGAKWIGDILYGHPERCKRMMRMETRDFLQLCYNLEHHYDLKPSRNMGVVEKTSILVFTLAQGGSNRRVQERFQHSGETISIIFHDVLCAVCKLAKDIIKPADPEFKDISPQILNDIRYMPHFKDCIGALDRTHIDVVVPIAEQVYILAVYSFDMKFTYVLAGFKGTAHDSRVLTKAITTPAYEFPRPPPGKYYLVDAGYSQLRGYLGPYRGVRYHLTDFQRGHPPQGYKEVFNQAHASLRSCIERTFGVWKKRWDILRDMRSYNYRTQVRIVVATMALHNYIRGITCNDELFQEADVDPDLVAEENLSDDEESHQSHQQNEIDNIRDQIALSLTESRN